jgi:ubiquinone/menaquinone biosynthesis C-methylase UbiE
MQRADDIVKLNEEMWDSRAETYDRVLSFTRWTQKKLVSLLRLGNGTNLLDLACGPGWAVRYAARLANGRGMFFGIDISSKMIERAKASSAGYSNVLFRKSKVEKLPFHDGFFDFVISDMAFHHFSNPEKALSEAHRVLKPRGRILILDGTADSFFVRLLDRVSVRLEPAHVKMYSTREYRELFEKAGLHYVASRRIVPFLKVHIGERI